MPPAPIPPAIEAWLWWQERQASVVGAVTRGQPLPDLGAKDAPFYHLMEATGSGDVESTFFISPRSRCRTPEHLLEVAAASFLFLSPPCEEPISAPGERGWQGPQRGLFRFPLMRDRPGQMSWLCVHTGLAPALCFPGKHLPRCWVIPPLRAGCGGGSKCASAHETVPKPAASQRPCESRTELGPRG